MNIAWAKGLEVIMNTLMALIFSSTISGGSYHIKADHAHSSELLPNGLADIHALLAWATHDVSQAGSVQDWRVG